MAINRYAAAVERTIFNWYLGGEDAPPEPVFNALQMGIKHDMQVYVPIELPDALFQMVGNPEKLIAGATCTCDQEVPLRFRHILEEGVRYFGVGGALGLTRWGWKNCWR